METFCYLIIMIFSAVLVVSLLFAVKSLLDKETIHIIIETIIALIAAVVLIYALNYAGWL